MPADEDLDVLGRTVAEEQDHVYSYLNKAQGPNEDVDLSFHTDTSARSCRPETTAPAMGLQANRGSRWSPRLRSGVDLGCEVVEVGAGPSAGGAGRVASTR